MNPVELMNAPIIDVVVPETTKKEQGVSLRKSTTADTKVERPRVSKTICITHSSRFKLLRSDMSWSCPECSHGRVPFSRWYKDTYSLGYITAHCYEGQDHQSTRHEVVVTVDEGFNPVALLVQRDATRKDIPVLVVDLGMITPRYALLKPLDQDGIRTFSLSELYGVGQHSSDGEEQTPTE